MAVSGPPTDESSLLKNDQRPAETHARDGEVHGADDGHDEQFRPDNIDAGRPVEDGLGEADKMRRGEDLHAVLQPDRHGLHRRGGAGEHLQDDEDRDHQEAELPHRGRIGGEQNAHRRHRKRVNEGSGQE
jgi:hypothetical protein